MMTSAITPTQMSGPSAFDDCLKLLRGKTNEEKFTGLLLVTKWFNHIQKTEEKDNNN